MFLRLTVQFVKAYFCSEDILLGEHFKEDVIARLDKRIRPYYSSRKWLPIAQFAGGSLYLMLDAEPRPNHSVRLFQGRACPAPTLALII
ncbi:hypothetical protein [Paenibacillus chitinolyticus]|uniref:hypothetical protein n=1 Tax=Paenibacillus chitinolyticus TaxID=79263 RepID=UPI00366C0859